MLLQNEVVVRLFVDFLLTPKTDKSRMYLYSVLPKDDFPFNFGCVG